MNDQDEMLRTERDRLLEISNLRASQGPNYDSKSRLKASVRSELLTLALDLHTQNFAWPAQAIAGYLLGKSNTLDQAFGLRRGRPMSKKTLKRDAVALQLRIIDGLSFNKIAQKTKMDRKDVRGLCQCGSKYERRFNAALAEILSSRITNSINT